MDSFIDSFVEVNPDVVVVSEYVQADRLHGRFLDQTAAGLGPDLILGANATMVSQLIEPDLLAELTVSAEAKSQMQLQAMEALQIGGVLYGMPLAAYTQVLFYNKRHTDRIPATLDDMIELSRDENILALPADFYHSFWGVNGFSGQVIIEENSAEITDGVVEWLSWLQIAQKEPNIVVSGEVEEPYELFAGGYATYFIGRSTLLPYLREQLGEQQVGVALLPFIETVQPEPENSNTDALARLLGASNPAGSFLELEVGVVSKVSTQKTLAMALLDFLADPVQQRQLAASDLGFVPLNQRVRVDYRLPDAEATIMQQSRTAPVIALGDIENFTQLKQIADDGYAQVLGGVLEPSEGASYIRNEIRQTIGQALSDSN